jgi:hypothetical protein
MDSAKAQLVDKLKSANNILVTVSRDPSVDQLAACLGLALLLDKQGKHVAAVFSGQVPSTLEFLQPEETFQQNTDSLRDFIIALDKSKADKLRYKVEDEVVKIFITPYKTAISQDDFDFSQGDFNVDVVIALGVQQQEDLDEAITVHGRILHDATVASINVSPDGGLGTINWHDPQASSLSELVTELAQALDSESLDGQIATALLTGIVSETGRFSNDRTHAQTMSMSAALMAAGANQQLVATKLEEANAPQEIPETDEAQGPEGEVPDSDGMIEIDHENDEPVQLNENQQFTDDQPTENDQQDAGTSEPEEFELPSPDVDSLPSEQPELPVSDVEEPVEADDQPMQQVGSSLSPGSKLITEPPTLGGSLTANTVQNQLDPVTDPMSLPNHEPPQLLERKPLPGNPSVADPPTDVSIPPPPAPQPFSPPEPTDDTDSAKSDEEKTLEEIEESVKREETTVVKPEAAEDGQNLTDVRDEVSRALASSDAIAQSNEPLQTLGSQPLGSDLHDEDSDSGAAVGPAVAHPNAPSLEEQIPGLNQTVIDPMTPPPPVESADTTPPGSPSDQSSNSVDDSNAPPPVPPPFPVQYGAASNPPQPPK